jgi:putative hemolysin
VINIEAEISARYPTLSRRQPLLSRSLIGWLRYLCHEQEFRQFEQRYPHLAGFDFVEQVLNYFEFDYRIGERDRARIPQQGRIVIVANHPIGSLDGLALLRLVGEIRRDVKVIANDVLYAIKPLRSLLLPVDNMGQKTPKENVLAIRDHLNSDGAVIIFPAGEVSRMSPMGVRDGRWNPGFLRFAQSTNAPILPMFVDGRNSMFFYALSFLAKPISTLWLVREMFKQARRSVDVHVGYSVYPKQYQTALLPPKSKAKLFKHHVYGLARGKDRLGWQPEAEMLATPESRQALKKEIQQCEMLGSTTDGKRIYLYRHSEDSCLMREIGRLRELTFRSVKEGTGLRRDIDAYDSYYDHVVLWDEDDLEIVGAYRMVPSARALAHGTQTPALYTQTLFDFKPEMAGILDRGLELGRSFVQPRYWGKRSLDYLWFGIGAYLRKYPDLKYMFGPVSISQSYPDAAKDMLVCFYGHYFGAGETLAEARRPYRFQAAEMYRLAESIFCEDYRRAFADLKQGLIDLGVSVPTLYKQYTELCEEGGVRFLAFNVDADFADCVDGLIVVDVDRIKASKRDRYMTPLDATVRKQKSASEAA